MKFYSCFLKRTFDILFSLILIVLLSPIMLIVVITQVIFIGFPIFFSQERIGKNERTFKLYKFRTMTNKRDKNGDLLPESQRLTKYGVFLRSTSLDELPELFLILIGKMSIIGPRPLPTYYSPFFKENEKKRHLVKGGLIPCDDLLGLAYVDWDTQLSCDAYYATHCSFKLDFIIFFKTIKILFDRFKTNYGNCERKHLNEERKDMYGE